MNRTNKKRCIDRAYKYKDVWKNKQKWRSMDRAYKHKDVCTEEMSNQINSNNKENTILISSPQENTISCEYSSELRTQFVFLYYKLFTPLWSKQVDAMIRSWQNEVEKI